MFVCEAKNKFLNIMHLINFNHQSKLEIKNAVYSKKNGNKTRE